jgi:dihydroxyacid dehydratase/phosphogluconate dehydratase
MLLASAEASGIAAVQLIGSGRTPDKIITEKSVENALRVLLAIGGSTNAIIHLTAIAGRVGIPISLEGVKDMVRLSDARMSGTAFGTVILHVTPDSASGGPLAFVRNGDRIKLSVKDRRIDLLVDAAELERRKKSSAPIAPPVPARGYGRLYAQEILGADEGCDFRFLKPGV